MMPIRSRVGDFLPTELVRAKFAKLPDWPLLNERFSMTWPTPCDRSPHRLCYFGGLDVVVHAEEIRRVVFVFQGSAAVIIAALERTFGVSDGVPFIRHVVGHPRQLESSLLAGSSCRRRSCCSCAC